MPTCPICSKEMKYINNSHLKSHGLTPTQFKEMYPDVESIPQEIRDGRSKVALVLKERFLKGKILRDIKRIENYNIKGKSCLNCNVLIPYEKRMNKFCSSKCSASFNNTGRKVQYSEEAKKKLKEVGRISGLRNIGYINQQKGWTQNEKKCFICNKIFIVDCITKNKKMCSNECKKKWHALNNPRESKTYSKWGHYKGIYCASSWELGFLVYNLDLGKDIKRCEITFEYNMNGQEKIYFPDFFMENKIYEVKGRELEDVALKTQAVIDAGYQIELIRKKEITPIIKFLKEKYSVKDLTQLYDKKI